MEKIQQRVLLFDIDGTLLDAVGEGSACFGRALTDVYGTSGPVDTYDMTGKTDWQILTDLMQIEGISLEVIEARRLEAFTAYAHHFEMTAPNLEIKIFPGVTPLLDGLKGDPRFILGLVTGNVREAVPHKLRAVGLDPGIFTFGAFGSDHPDRNALPGLALNRLGQMEGVSFPAESTLVIGDTPRDIHCARYAGMKVMCVTTGQYDRITLAGYHPDYLLEDLSDTDSVMDILLHF